MVNYRNPYCFSEDFFLTNVHSYGIIYNEIFLKKGK